MEDPTHQGVPGQPPERPRSNRRPLPQQVAACLNKNPHFSPPRVPKIATQAGHSCYKEGFPVWLQIPLSPRQMQEQDAGARAGSAPTVSSHQEMCLPSIFGVSSGSDHSLRALNGALAAMITQIPGKEAQGGSTGAPLQPSPHQLSIRPDQDRDDQGQATQACQYPPVCCDKKSKHPTPPHPLER